MAARAPQPLAVSRRVRHFLARNEDARPGCHELRTFAGTTSRNSSFRAGGGGGAGRPGRSGAPGPEGRRPGALAPVRRFVALEAVVVLGGHMPGGLGRRGGIRALRWRSAHTPTVPRPSTDGRGLLGIRAVARLRGECERCVVVGVLSHAPGRRTRAAGSAPSMRPCRRPRSAASRAPGRHPASSQFGRPRHPDH